MRNFVKLHTTAGECIFVNPRFARLIVSVENGTSISIDGEKGLWICAESIGEVMEKIAEAEKAP